MYVVVLLAVAYVGAYGWLRSSDRMVLFDFTGVSTPWGDRSPWAGRKVISKPTEILSFDGTRKDPVERLFRPCIAVEEWWRNR